MLAARLHGMRVARLAVVRRSGHAIQAGGEEGATAINCRVGRAGMNPQNKALESAVIRGNHEVVAVYQPRASEPVSAALGDDAKEDGAH